MEATIICDLSEVIIPGVLGIEKRLGLHLNNGDRGTKLMGQHPLIPVFFRGEISEDTFITQVLEDYGWRMHREHVKQVVRKAFAERILYTENTLYALRDEGHDLILLSDHAREWAEYIQSIHRFFGIFRHVLFSFDHRLRSLKVDPETFPRVLSIIERPASDCILVDDNPANGVAANAAGIDFVHFKNWIGFHAGLRTVINKKALVS